MAPHTEVEHIALNIPGRPEYVVVVRLAAAAIAGRMAFSFDDVEDLKIAVGEVCTAAILGGSPEIRVLFEVHPDRLTTHIRHRMARAARSNQAQELDKLLVRVLTDEVATEADGDDQVTRLVKRIPA